MLDKISVYNVLAERMYFLDTSSPSNFNFFDLSACLNSSYNFWNQESVCFYINFAPFCSVLAKFPNFLETPTYSFSDGPFFPKISQPPG